MVRGYALPRDPVGLRIFCAVIPLFAHVGAIIVAAAAELRLSGGDSVSWSHLMWSRRAFLLIEGRENGGDDEEDDRGRFQRGGQGIQA